MDNVITKSKDVTLVEVLDRVLDKGAVVSGDIVISVADVDLIYIGLKVLVSSVETMERLRGAPMPGLRRSQHKMDKPSIVITVKDIEEIKDANPERINIDPKNVEKGLAKLALTLVELIRKLLEKQAMRRIEAGSLSDEEVERIGETLLKLENKIQELKEIFGLKDEELNLNLGPLGNLM